MDSSTIITVVTALAALIGAASPIIVSLIQSNKDKSEKPTGIYVPSSYVLHRPKPQVGWSIVLFFAFLGGLVGYGGAKLASDNPSNVASTPTITIAVVSKTPEPTFTNLVLTEASTSTATETVVTAPSSEVPTAVATDLPAGAVEVSLSDGMKILYVPAGEFIMGAENGEPDESPAHKVYLDSYWIDQTEVTNAMYKTCVDVGTCPSPINEEYFGKSKYADYPVVYVTWNNAKSYCEWAGRRLPTEAEWEKAARGADGRIYPWGDGTNCRKANYDSCFGGMRIVGAYDPGPYGTLDMVGNAWEWVSDWYDEFYYEKSPYDNPQGSPTGEYRGLRSGSWETNSKNVRTSSRSYSSVDDFNYKISFRCARTP